MERHRERHQLALRRRGSLVAAALLVAGLLGVLSGTEGDASRDEGVAVTPLLDALGDEAVSEYALDLLGRAEGERRESDRSLAEEGERVLEDYRLRGDCIVAQAGYLDLSGKVWGCVVQGAGWVELCVIREGDEGGSEVVSWHMDADDVGR